MSLRVSVVVCTRNRAGKLVDLLNSFLDLDLRDGPTTEFIIVDNGSTDTTREVAQDFSKRARNPVRYIFEAHKGKSRALNTGIGAASGDILLFTDDDCIVPPNWVRQAAAGYHGKDDLRLVGGRVELFNSAHAPIAIKTSQMPDTLELSRNLYGFAHGCNLAVTKKLFEVIGPFDPHLGPGTQCRSAEDMDFIYRTAKVDAKIVYDPTMYVFHNHGRSMAEAKKLERGYKTGKGAMLSKYLLRGQTDLAKIAYWEALSLFRLYKGRQLLSELATECFILKGSLIYLTLAIFGATKPPDRKVQ